MHSCKCSTHCLIVMWKTEWWLSTEWLAIYMQQNDIHLVNDMQDVQWPKFLLISKISWLQLWDTIKKGKSHIPGNRISSISFSSLLFSYSLISSHHLSCSLFLPSCLLFCSFSFSSCFLSSVLFSMPLLLLISSLIISLPLLSLLFFLLFSPFCYFFLFFFPILLSYLLYLSLLLASCLFFSPLSLCVECG